MGTVTGLWTRGRGIVRFQTRPSDFLFFEASRPTVEHTQPLTDCVPSVVSPEVKWLGREADHTPTSDAEVTKTFNPPYTLILCITTCVNLYVSFMPALNHPEPWT